MPNMDTPLPKIIKLLYVGESGTGKTGALASLALAGYKLRVIDADNGMDILKVLLAGKGTDVDYVTVTDAIKTQVTPNGMKNAIKIAPLGGAKGFAKALNLLDRWKYKNPDGTEVDLGKVESWGADTVLVIDSLDHLSDLALDNVLDSNNRLGQGTQIQDWGTAMAQIEALIQLLTSASIQCHVIVISHIVQCEVQRIPQPAGEDKVIYKAYPAALGNKLPPKVGTYFNSLLIGTKVGSKRVFTTETVGTLDAKSFVTNLPSKSLPIETGLATYFEAYCGKLNKS